MTVANFTTDMDIIAALADLPNATDGLSAAQLKAKFDEGGNALKTYINGTLVAAVNTHLAETVSKIGSFTRDGATAGTQKITTGFRPKSINLYATLSLTAGLASWGQANESLGNMCMYDAGSYSTAGAYTIQEAISIYIRKTAANAIYGVVTLIEDDGFTITWTVEGVGVTGTITTIYNATTH